MSSKIKSMEVHTETKEGQNFISERSEYDLQGNVTLQEEYNSEGEVESRIDYVYNDKSQLIEQKQLVENNELADHKIYFRDDSGKITRTEIFFHGGSKSIQTVNLDLENQIEELIEVDEEGELESREVNHFNENKKILLKESYNFDNKLTEAFKYEYDESGKLLRRDQLDHRRKLILYTEYEYDDSGRTLFRASRNRKGRLSDFLKIDYDENGQVIKQNFSGKYYFVFEYDQKGNTVLEERYADDEQLEYQSRFEYDANNHLTREINLEFTREMSYQFHED